LKPFFYKIGVDPKRGRRSENGNRMERTDLLSRFGFMVSGLGFRV